jgi:hypothetical protein
MAMIKRLRLVRGRARGAAIMLAIWALFVLSVMVVSWALDIGTKVTNSGYANRSLEAVAMACSGAEIAMAIPFNSKPNLPVLKGTFGKTQSYDARITGEAGRINLNWVAAGLLTGDQMRHELLRKFLEVKGIDLNDRDRMIDCLKDWVDPDNLVSLNGAEDDGGYKAANRPLASLEDLKRIRGWEEFTSQPDWDADLTLKSDAPPTQGTIDIRWASRDVLLSLPEMTEGQVDRFIAVRRGPDDIEGTEDDLTFKEPRPTPAEALGITQQQFDQFAQPLLVPTNAPAEVLRIVSVGKSGAVTRTVRMVVRKSGNAIQLLTWKEL